jgi:predicted RNase H-like nuclease
VAVLGVDACRAGWAGVVLGAQGTVTGVFATDIGGLVERASVVAELEAIGIDMPIGLPDVGRRAADVLARAFVGPRWQSVFLTPVRATLDEPTHSAASRRSRELTGEGISQQVFALRPRMAELDLWVASSGLPVIEVHPEVSFAVLAGRTLPDRKKSWAGAARRRALLGDAGVVVPDDLGRMGVQAAVDDVLDAAVVAWTARRYANGQARCFPDPPETFSDGHRAAIWA